MSDLWSKSVLAALSISLMGFGQAANAAGVLVSEFRNVPANANVSTPMGSDSVSTSRNSLSDFFDFDELVEVDFTLEDASANGTAQLPTAAWLFISSLLGLVGIARRNKTV